MRRIAEIGRAWVGQTQLAGSATGVVSAVHYVYGSVLYTWAAATVAWKDSLWPWTYQPALPMITFGQTGVYFAFSPIAGTGTLGFNQIGGGDWVKPIAGSSTMAMGQSGSGVLAIVAQASTQMAFASSVQVALFRIGAGSSNLAFAASGTIISKIGLPLPPIIAGGVKSERWLAGTTIIAGKWSGKVMPGPANSARWRSRKGEKIA